MNDLNEIVNKLKSHDFNLYGIKLYFGIMPLDSDGNPLAISKVENFDHITCARTRKLNNESSITNQLIEEIQRDLDNLQKPRWKIEYNITKFGVFLMKYIPSGNMLRYTKVVE